MRWIKWISVSLVLLMVTATFAGEGARPFQINNRLRVGYNDNVYKTEDNKKGTAELIEEVEFLVNLNFEKSFVSLRYKPQFVWYSDREPDDTELNHDFDFVFNQTFTPRVSLSVLDTLRYGEQPEGEEGDNFVREEDNFYYNALVGTLGFQLKPQTKLELSGRWNLLQYEGDAKLIDTITGEEVDGKVENRDYNMYIGGISLRHRLASQMTLIGDLRYEDMKYKDQTENVDRDYASTYVGVGAENTFSPNLIGSARIGYQYMGYSDSDIDSSSSPYGDVSLTFLPSPATRISGGLGYSMTESDVMPYSSQNKAKLYASIANDLTRRITWYLTGSYSRGNYKADTVTDQTKNTNITDGHENIYQASARATYQLNKSNWLGLSWQLVALKVSDLQNREEYTQNRISADWKTQF